MGDLKAKNKNGWLKFNLPNGKNNMLKTRNVGYEKGKMKYWSGQDTSGIESSFLSFVNEGCRGYIRKDGDTYEIYPLGSNLHALVKHKPTVGEDCTLGHNHKKEGNVLPPSESRDTLNLKENKLPDQIQLTPNQADVQRIEPCLPNADAVVRILYYFTPNAVDALMGGNIRAVAENTVNQMNNALAASGLTNRVALIDVLPFPVPFTNATGLNTNDNIDNDLFRMRTEPNVLNGRDALRADVVGFLTVGNFGNVAGTVTNSNPGGDPLANYPNDNLSFFVSQVVNADQANGFTAAHEFGHLFRARHQRSSTFSTNSSDDSGNFEHGFSWRTRTTCATRFLGVCFSWNFDRRASIMHNRGRRDNSNDPNTEYVRSLFYSNPNVNQPGTSTPTGTNNDNNARQINVQFSTVANFRRDNNILPGLNVQIESPFLVSPTQIYCPEAVVSCGQAPYTFSWRISYDGFNFFPWSSDESFCDFGGDAGSNKLYELTVTDAAGTVVSAYLQVDVFNFTPFRLESESLSNTSGVTAENLRIVQPNPANDKINLSFALENDNAYAVTLLDLNGKVIKQIKKDNPFKGSTQNLELNVSDLPNGMYFVKIAGSVEYFTEKIIVNH